MKFFDSLKIAAISIIATATPLFAQTTNPWQNFGNVAVPPDEIIEATCANWTDTETAKAACVTENKISGIRFFPVEYDFIPASRPTSWDFCEQNQVIECGYAQPYQTVIMPQQVINNLCESWTDTTAALAACVIENIHGRVTVVPVDHYAFGLRYLTSWEFCEFNQDLSNNPNAVADNVCEI